MAINQKNNNSNHRDSSQYSPPEIDTETNSLKSKKRTLFLLLENFSMVSFTGAVDVLTTANLLTSGPVFVIDTASVEGTHVMSDLGIEISVSSRLEDIYSAEIDILIICGGLRTPLQNVSAIQKIIKHSINRDIWVGGLWNGVYFIADSGVWEHHECALHPGSRDIMKERYPKARISRASYIIDGKFFSCVGPNGALRVMLDLLELIFDVDMKRGVNGILLADSNRSINSAVSHGVNLLPEKLETIIELMESNLEEPLELSDFSAYTSLSRRQIERLFERYLNTTPARYYLELRLNKGRQLLLHTNYSISEVTFACGFTNTTHFSRSFKAMFGTSPTSARSCGVELF